MNQSSKEAPLGLRLLIYGVGLMGLAGLLIMMLSEFSAYPTEYQTPSHPAAIAFHTKTVWVTQSTADRYRLGRWMFFLGLGLVVVISVYKRDMDEDDRAR